MMKLEKTQKMRKLLRCSKVAMLMLFCFNTALFAQTDYSGTYYIASKDYNSSTPANNFYLCPTEGWAFYQAVDDFTSTDNGQPFLTTHQCRDGQYDVENKAVWIVEKHPTTLSVHRTANTLY